jgi:hypothetical protein
MERFSCSRKMDGERPVGKKKTCSTLAPEAISSIPTRFDEFDEKREGKRYLSTTKGADVGRVEIYT